eukprot:TRINITY_DN1415_c0_g2_i1.p1 TRINITY_DN1415_c0_g2~~TRINITY_DN1415_c0_g2_i1.p1  ORF type:complete len:106 (-),score=23.80 TRINITY_DN1415_c0_g2_i1:110-427(-)
MVVVLSGVVEHPLCPSLFQSLVVCFAYLVLLILHTNEIHQIENNRQANRQDWGVGIFKTMKSIIYRLCVEKGCVVVSILFVLLCFIQTNNMQDATILHTLSVSHY